MLLVKLAVEVEPSALVPPDQFSTALQSPLVSTPQMPSAAWAEERVAKKVSAILDRVLTVVFMLIFLCH